MREKTHDLPSRSRVAALACAGLLAASAAVPATALADNEPGVEGYSGSGTTELVVRLANVSEYGGTAASGDSANPDGDGDGLGDNIAFKVPTKINYIVSANGKLTAPAASAVYLENFSAYPIHASSLEAKAATGSASDTWTFVGDCATASEANAVQLSIKPNGGTAVSAHDYVSKTALPASSIADWNMASATSAAGVVSDRVQMEMKGAVSNVVADLSSADGAKFGELVWYVTPGKAENQS